MALQHSNLRSIIEKTLDEPLPEAAFKKFLELSFDKSFDKKEFFVEPGKSCNYQYLILEGSCYSYYINEKGDKTAIQFAIENYWITDAASYFANKPAVSTIETLEPTRVLMLSRQNFDLLCKGHPLWDRYFRILLQTTLAHLHYRIAKTTSEDADIPPGIVFCLRAEGVAAEKIAESGYPLAPHYLVHVDEEGSVLLPYTQAKRIMDRLKRLSLGRDLPDAVACARHDKETKQGKDMRHAQQLLAAAIASVAGKLLQLIGCGWAGGTSARRCLQTSSSTQGRVRSRRLRSPARVAVRNSGNDAPSSRWGMLRFRTVPSGCSSRNGPKSAPRFASFAPFCRLIVDHLLWPDIGPPRPLAAPPVGRRRHSRAEIVLVREGRFYQTARASLSEPAADPRADEARHDQRSTGRRR